MNSAYPALAMRRLDIALLVMLAPLLTAALGGCAAPKPMETGPTSEAPNPIRVSHVTSAFTVGYAPGAATPDAKETAALNAFLAQAEASIGDTVVIARPESAHGATSVIEDKRAARMVTALTRQGLKPRVTAAATVAEGEMTLTLDRYIALPPDCPNWSKAPGNDFANTLHSDFGCSTATNLAAMVDRPRDLIEGREMAGAVGDPALAAMHRYRGGGKGDKSGDSNAGAPGPAQSFTVAPAPPAETTTQ
jgi:pilus assembly protein CpaD